MPEDIYAQNGYHNRADYLRQLANDNNVLVSAVFALADLYGPNEDFDGLVSSVQDMGLNEGVLR